MLSTPRLSLIIFKERQVIDPHQVKHKVIKEFQKYFHIIRKMLIKLFKFKMKKESHTKSLKS